MQTARHDAPSVPRHAWGKHARPQNTRRRPPHPRKALTAACGKSEKEVAVDCQKALAQSTAGATKKDRPEACNGLPQEEYEAILMSEAMKDTCVIDEESNVDLDELLNEQ